MNEFIANYISSLGSALDGVVGQDIEAVVNLLTECRFGGGKVFVFGNGGSASTASHLACDLGKNTRVPGLPNFKVLSLSDNTPMFTALANDHGYERTFADQLDGFVSPGDVAIGISTSGKSPNVLRAVELASRHGAKTVGFTGFDGGKLAGLVDVEIRVPSHSIEHVEDGHLVLQHMICLALRTQTLGYESVDSEIHV